MSSTVSDAAGEPAAGPRSVGAPTAGEPAAGVPSAGSPGGGGPGGGGGEPGGGGPGGDGEVGGGRRRRSRVPLIGAVAVGCITALLVAVLATSKSASSAVATPSPLQNRPAPDISGPLLGSGSDRLSAYKGTWVWVNFFASWCVPCQQEQGDLVRFQNAHPNGDALIFGVRFDDADVGAIQQLMAKSGAHWPIVDDPNAKFEYGVTGPPESFLISPGGIVLVHVFGRVDTGLLERLLSQAKLVVTTPRQSPTSPPGSTTP